MQFSGKQLKLKNVWKCDRFSKKTQQTWSGFSPATVPDNNRQSGLSPMTVSEMSTGKVYTRIPKSSLVKNYIFFIVVPTLVRVQGKYIVKPGFFCNGYVTCIYMRFQRTYHLNLKHWLFKTYIKSQIPLVIAEMFLPLCWLDVPLLSKSRVVSFCAPPCACGSQNFGNKKH